MPGDRGVLRVGSAFGAVCVRGGGGVVCAGRSAKTLQSHLLLEAGTLHSDGCPCGGSRTCVEGDSRDSVDQLHSLPSAQNHTSPQPCSEAVPLPLAGTVRSCLPGTKGRGNLPGATQEWGQAYTVSPTNLVPICDPRLCPLLASFPARGPDLLPSEPPHLLWHPSGQGHS